MKNFNIYSLYQSSFAKSLFATIASCFTIACCDLGYLLGTSIAASWPISLVIFLTVVGHSLLIFLYGYTSGALEKLSELASDVFNTESLKQKKNHLKKNKNILSDNAVIKLCMTIVVLNFTIVPIVLGIVGLKSGILVFCLSITCFAVFIFGINNFFKLGNIEATIDEALAENSPSLNTSATLTNTLQIENDLSKLTTSLVDTKQEQLSPVLTSDNSNNLQPNLTFFQASANEQNYTPEVQMTPSQSTDEYTKLIASTKNPSY